MQLLTHIYNVSYASLHRGKSTPIDKFPVVFENEKFPVIKLRPHDE
jgi:hypothetical protein